jgi:hypothetical protein
VADPVNTGFDPLFGDPMRRFRAALAAQGIDTNIFSGVRDRAKQQGLYENRQAELAGQPLPHPEMGYVPRAAVPGTSLHERGLAADIRPSNPADLPKMYALARQYGIQPLGASDPYHFQLGNWQQAEATQAQPTPWDQTNPANVPSRMAMNMEADAPGSQSDQPGNSNVIDTLSRNIAGIESGGWKNPYEALNPTTHAIGKYQVMPNNVPGWTQAALGSSMSPEEFKASPSAQEAVFRDQMQRNLQLYGPKDAASIWFTGRPYNVAGGAATDANKTTNASYVARATAGLPDSGTFTPTQAPGPIDPSIIAHGGYSPPIPTTPGTTINSNPIAGGLGGQIGQLAGNLKKDLGLDDKAQAPPEAPQAPPAPPARNVSPLLGNPQIYAQRMAGLNQPMTWGGGPPGQMYGAGYGPQNQPVYGTSLMSQLQMLSDPTWMNQMAGG